VEPLYGVSIAPAFTELTRMRTRGNRSARRI
jgi:hypothetical protein